MRRSRCLGLRVYHCGARTHAYAHMPHGTHAHYARRGVRAPGRLRQSGTMSISVITMWSIETIRQRFLSMLWFSVNNVFGKYHRKHIHERSLYPRHYTLLYGTFQAVILALSNHKDTSICIKHRFSIYRINVIIVGLMIQWQINFIAWLLPFMSS